MAKEQEDEFNEVSSMLSKKADEIMNSDIVESVVIIATSRVDGSTVMFHSSRGNIYANQGAILAYTQYKNVERKRKHQEMLDADTDAEEQE